MMVELFFLWGDGGDEFSMYIYIDILYISGSKSSKAMNEQIGKVRGGWRMIETI